MKNRFYILFILVCALVSNTRAGHTIRTQYLQGDAIAQGAVLSAKDDYYFKPLDGTDYKLTNRVRLYHTEQLKKYHSQSWALTVRFDVYKWYNGTALTPELNKTLKVTYDPTTGYVDEKVFVTDSANYIQVRVKSVTFKVGSVTYLGINHSSNYDDIFLQAEVDVERYFDFNDSTAIAVHHRRVNAHTYEVFWPYAQGAEEYDLEWYFSCGDCVDRPTDADDVDDMDFTRVTVTQNHFQLNVLYDTGTVFYRVRPVGKHGTHYLQRFEGTWSSSTGDTIKTYNRDQEKNWTYNAVFAEEGKMKEVVSYFDGSGRNRQMVTRLNTQDIAIVGESHYDFEGRPALQTIPVPTHTKSTYLKFYDLFSLNRVGNGDTLYKNGYDKDQNDICDIQNLALYAVTGTGNYFSKYNSYTTGFNAYLPRGTASATDSSSYAYTRTVYGRDGRVKLQSGVGYDHRIGSGHEVGYDYATPYQEKIDRMFGNEIGFTEHYRVTRTVDPNGQLSLSYADLEGKVIATSLVGPEPNGMDTLSSKPGTGQNFTASFNNMNKYVPAEQAYVVNNTFLVEYAGEHTFTYNITPQQFSSLCGEDGDTCQYELTIAIYNSCNQKVYEDGHDENNKLYLDTTLVITKNTTMPLVMTVDFEEAGVYLMYKKLGLYIPYMDTAIANFEAALPGTCATLSEFQEDYTESIDWSNCDACTTSCEPQIPEMDCSSLLGIMKEDMSPGGQYFDNTTVNSTSAATDSWLTQHVYVNGTSSFFTSNFGSGISDWGDVRDNWQSVWADTLVKYHPEYCHYKTCKNLEASTDYDIALLQINTWSAANSLGYVETTCDSTRMYKHDPFYTNLALSADKTAMLAAFSTQYPGNGFPSGWCLYDVALDMADSCSSCDTLWIHYRNLYLGLKYRHIENYKANVCDTYDAPVSTYYYNPFTSSLYYLCDQPQALNGNASTLVMDLIGDNCWPNPAWDAVGMWIRVPDVGGFMNNLTGPADTTIAQDTVTAAGNTLIHPCNGHYAFAQFTSIIECDLNPVRVYVNGVAATASLNLSSLAGNWAAVADSIADAINAYSSSPDYDAISFGTWVEIRSVLHDDVYNGYEVQVACDADTNEAIMDFGADTLDPCPTIACICVRIQQEYQYLIDHEGLTPTQAEDTLAAIYNELYGLSVTDANIASWIDSCENGNYTFSPTIPDTLYTPCEEQEYQCVDNPESLNLAGFYASDDYEEYTDSLVAVFTANYIASCMPQTSTGLSSFETFTVTSKDYEYHYTLYYYDQAGNLTRTVPPNGVDILAANEIENVQDHRENSSNPAFAFIRPQHTMISCYKYNTLNQVTCQCMPDATGALTLTEDGTTITSASLSDIDMVSSTVGYTIEDDGTNTTIYKTTDGGGTWSSSATINTFRAQAIYMLDGDNGYVAGNTGKVYYSTNASAGSPTWTAVTTGVSDNFTDIVFTNTTTGFIVGDGGRILKINHTNHTTSSVASGSEDYRAVAYDGNNYIHMVGQGGVAKRMNVSTNAITTTGPISTYNMRGIAMLDENTAVSVGQNGSSNAVIYRSTNLASGSPSWSSVLSGGATATLTDVQFTSSGAGYVTGTGGVFYTTNNYGLTWTQQSFTTSSNTNYAICAAGNGNVMVAGVDQTIALSAADCDQRFWYDDLGRIKASQDARQAAHPDTAYSYTVYDALGRITEAGQVYTDNGYPTRTQLNPTGATPWPTTWVGSGETFYEVSYTSYDEEITGIVSEQFTNGQQNLRTRVGTTWFKNLSTDTDTAYATHYSYDIHGNVEEMVQEFPALEDDYDQRFKKMEYSYDLISGNVNMVCYQRGEVDAFYHEYVYDADNRVTHAFTSRDSLVWDNDAKYMYYLHGPLARTEIGDKKVQGMDYAYTVHGWLKGVNSSNLDYTDDMGKDGYPKATSPTNPYVASPDNKLHHNVARDAFGFALGYYSGDYGAITAATFGNDWWKNVDSVNSGSVGGSLYNGNIRHMATSLLKTDETRLGNALAIYRYDQLNRLKQADYWKHATTYASASTNTDDYREQYWYDANGNITVLNRNGYAAAPSGKSMDEFEYTYIAGTNKLDHVDDVVADGNYSDDMNDQNTGNYDYDAMGNLIQDTEEGITSIEWNARGKVKKVTKGSSDEYIEFEYDALGQRVKKYVHTAAQQDGWYTIYYVRDAQGNVMTMYKQHYTEEDVNDYAEHFSVEEQDIYGSSLIGVNTLGDDLYRRTFSCSTFHADGRFNAVYDDMVATIPAGEHLLRQRNVGKKQYFLTDHRRNNYVSVTDRKFAVQDGSTGFTNFWTADVVSHNHYSSFGALQPNLHGFTAGSNIRWGQQMQEREDELLDKEGSMYSYEYRFYNPHLGKFLTPDPLHMNFPWNSTYAFSENRVIDAVELEGKEAFLEAAMGKEEYSSYTKLQAMSSDQLANVMANGTSKDKEAIVRFEQMSVALSEGSITAKAVGVLLVGVGNLLQYGRGTPLQVGGLGVEMAGDAILESEQLGTTTGLENLDKLAEAKEQVKLLEYKKETIITKQGKAQGVIAEGLKDESNSDNKQKNSARFVVDKDGTAVDTKSTPQGRYKQPNGDETDVLQRKDHYDKHSGENHGKSHTHEYKTNVAPDGTKRVQDTKRTHKVTYDEAKNIENGKAKIIKQTKFK